MQEQDGCELNNEMEEELVIDKKPFPGLQVFSCSNSLTFFSVETILAQKLGSTTANQCIDNQDVLSAMLHLSGDPEVVFYMMSVCPDEEVVNICRECWEQNTFKVSVFNVICVFLNWGATLESLGFENDQQLPSHFVPTLSPTFLSDFPALHNVNAILDSISGRLSIEEDKDADKQRFDLVRVLMTASLDHRLRQHRFKFNQVICAVLETFPDWSSDKVSVMVEHLRLPQMGLQNAAYICCSFFHSASPRIRDLKDVSIRHLLHSKFNLLSPLEPFPSLLENLPPAEEVVERFRMLEIYILMQLVNSLLIICYNIHPPCSVGCIEALSNWAQAVHSTLLAPKFLLTVEGGYVRDKCVRLRAECVELVCTLKKEANPWEKDLHNYRCI